MFIVVSIGRKLDITKSSLTLFWTYDVTTSGGLGYKKFFTYSLHYDHLFKNYGDSIKVIEIREIKFLLEPLFLYCTKVWFLD